ncbi:GntR family transcriptional regulator [soil metagenome]
MWCAEASDCARRCINHESWYTICQMTDIDVRPVGAVHQPLTRRVADRLRERIVSGDLAPGTRLVERALADELAVSRVPVREALRVLAAEGFAVERPRRGMVVHEPSDDEVEQLLEVREALETALCLRLARPPLPRGLAVLDASVAEAAAAIEGDDHAGAVRANADFHRALVDADPEALAGQLLRPLGARLAWMLRQHADVRLLFHEHASIVEAVRAGDADRVRRLMDQHLVTSRVAYDQARAAAQAAARVEGAPCVP